MLRGFKSRSELQALRSEGRVVLSSAACRGVVVAVVALILWISLDGLNSALLGQLPPHPLECWAVLARPILSVCGILAGGVVVGVLSSSLAQTRAAFGVEIFKRGPHRRAQSANPSLVLMVLAVICSAGMFCGGAPALLAMMRSSESPQLIGQQLVTILSAGFKLVVVVGVVSAILVWSVERMTFLFRYRNKAR